MPSSGQPGKPLVRKKICFEKPRDELPIHTVFSFCDFLRLFAAEI